MTNRLCKVDEYAEDPRASFRINKKNYNYENYTFFFFGIKPKVKDIILIKDVEKLSPDKENEVRYLYPNNWRKAKLEDFLNFDTTFDIYEQDFGGFSSKESREFIKNNLETFKSKALNYLSEYEIKDAHVLLWNRRISLTTRLIEEMTKANKIINKDEVEKITKEITWITRFAYIAGCLQKLMSDNHTELIENFNIKEDNEKIREIKNNPDELLNFLKTNESTPLKLVIIDRIIKLICDENNRVRPEKLYLLKSLVDEECKIDDESLRWTLEPTIKGKTIDISQAKVVKRVSLGDALKAERIGKISSKKHALELKTENGTTYIQGSKKLKREIHNLGGHKEKYGCNLVIEETLPKKLIEIEQIRAMAFLNPKELIKTLKDKKINTKEIEKIVPKIEKDYTESKKLADSAIELLYHIDPKSARKLIKGERI